MIDKGLSRSYTYRLRTTYDKSGELLLEFQLSSSNTEFVRDLIKALESIDPQIVSTESAYLCCFSKNTSRLIAQYLSN